LLHLEVCTGILRDGVTIVFQYSHRLKRGNRVTPYGKFALLIMLGASAALSSQSPPQAADATKVGDIEVPTLGPTQDPLGIKTSATEFPCGGLSPVAHTAATEGAPHAYAIPIGTRMENSAWKVDKVCTKSGWLAQPKHRVIDLTK
jgi:hypothetical protein